MVLKLVHTQDARDCEVPPVQEEGAQSGALLLFPPKLVLPSSFGRFMDGLGTDEEARFFSRRTIGHEGGCGHSYEDMDDPDEDPDPDDPNPTEPGPGTSMALLPPDRLAA